MSQEMVDGIIKKIKKKGQKGSKGSRGVGLSWHGLGHSQEPMPMPKPPAPDPGKEPDKETGDKKGTEEDAKTFLNNKETEQPFIEAFQKADHQGTEDFNFQGYTFPTKGVANLLQGGGADAKPELNKKVEVKEEEAPKKYDDVQAKDVDLQKPTAKKV